MSRKFFLHALTPSPEESGYHSAPAATSYLDLSNKTCAKPRITTQGKDSRRARSCVKTPYMPSRDDFRFHCVWALVKPSAFGGFVLLAAGHEIKKPPFGRIPWPMTDDQPIAVVTRMILEWPFWPSSARRPSGRFQRGADSVVAAQGSL